MFHPTLAAAMAEATPAACAALNAQGVRVLVAVENAEGRWFFLHADSVHHAHVLADVWVDPARMGARGCSIWSIDGGRVARRSIATVFQPFDWED